MSIERGLLGRVISGDDAGDFFIGYSLYKDIETFLAQPEQESVYQKLSRIEDGIEVEMLPSEVWLDGYETGKRTMQPEQKPSSDDYYKNIELRKEVQTKSQN